MQQLKREQEQRESEMLPPVIHPPRPKKAYKRKPIKKGQHLAAMPRRKEIVEMRIAGKTVPFIAQTLGLADGTVQKHLRDWVLSNTPSDEATSELRKIMHERLEAMHDRHWQQAMGIQNEDGSWRIPPSKDAGEFCLKIMDREAKLMGVDMQPSQTTLLISAESIAAYLGWDPQPGHSAVIDVTPTEEPDERE